MNFHDFFPKLTFDKKLRKFSKSVTWSRVLDSHWLRAFESIERARWIYVMSKASPTRKSALIGQLLLEVSALFWFDFEFWKSNSLKCRSFFDLFILPELAANKALTIGKSDAEEITVDDHDYYCRKPLQELHFEKWWMRQIKQLFLKPHI